MRCDNCENEISVWQTGYKVGNMTVCSECHKTQYDKLKQKEEEKSSKSSIQNEEETKDWYYAKENEQIGPIGKGELLNLIKQDVVKGENLVWTQGMEDWKKSKEVDALKKEIDKSTVPNAEENKSNIQEESFFETEGRLQRKKYFIRVFLLSIPAGFFNVVSEGSSESALIGFLALLTLVCSIFVIIQVVKRLHDINMSGWYWLLFMIPVVNFIFGLYVLFKDGTVGPNQYGKDPKGRVAESS